MKHLHPNGWHRVIYSRDVNELLPTVRSKCVDFLSLCNSQGMDVVIASTYVDHEAQAKLYARGRTIPNTRIVTHDPPLWSWANWRCAFTVVPIWFGRPLSEHAVDLDEIEFWHRIGESGEAVGLEWGGRWDEEKRRFAHFQFTFGFSLEQVNAGQPLPETLQGPISDFTYRGTVRHAFGIAFKMALLRARQWVWGLRAWQ